MKEASSTATGVGHVEISERLVQSMVEVEVPVLIDAIGTDRYSVPEPTLPPALMRTRKRYHCLKWEQSMGLLSSFNCC